jgi:hypothetical protein
MSTATATIAQKLAMIFGIGTQLVGTYTANKINYTDGKSKLEFDVTDETRKDAGVYTVTVKSDTEIDEQFQKAAETTTSGTKTDGPVAKQSPSNYLSGRDPR